MIHTEKELEAFGKRLQKAKVISLDTETTSLLYPDLELVGFSIAHRRNSKTIESQYIPVSHSKGKNIKGWKPFLKNLLKRKDLKVVFHNVKYDKQVLDKVGVPYKCQMNDSMIEAWLVNENRRSFGLKQLMKDLFNKEPQTFEDMSAGREIQDVPMGEAATYAEADAENTLLLFEKFDPQIDLQELRQAYEKVEIPTALVLGDMAKYGVPVDDALRRRMIAECDHKTGLYRNKIYQDLGGEFNINSGKQLGDRLEGLGIRCNRTEKGNYSLAAGELELLAKRTPQRNTVKNILQYRWYAKMAGTFLIGLEPVIVPHGEHNRIYPSFMQTVVVTGRLSSHDPNMQNFPLEQELGVRACIIPFEGDLMVVIDYSQIELRLAAHFSEDPAMLQAFRDGVDIHQLTADALGISRDTAKTINFGILYGLSAYHLSESLGIPRREAQAIIDRWFDKYPRVRDYKEHIERYVQKFGYVKTLSGRKRRLPDVRSSEWKLKGYALRQALNSVIQGSGADLIKYAMTKVAAKYKQKPPARIIASVHDELLVSVDANNAEEIGQDIKHIMESCLTLKVPVVADLQVARNWWWGKFAKKVKVEKDVPRLLRPQWNEMTYLEV